jgi:hypothetical protein
MKPYLLSPLVFILAFGPMQMANATGPAGSTGVVATVPGPVVTWRPGDPVPPQAGLLSILTSPNPPSWAPPQPAGRDTGVRKQ